MATEEAAAAVPGPTPSGLNGDGSDPAAILPNSEGGGNGGVVPDNGNDGSVNGDGGAGTNNEGVSTAPDSGSPVASATVGPESKAGPSDINLDSKNGESPDKLGDKIDDLNSLGTNVGPAANANAATNNGTNSENGLQPDLNNDPKAPNEDSTNGMVLPESQDGQAANQSSPSTKAPEVLTTAAGKPLNPVQEVCFI